MKKVTFVFLLTLLLSLAAFAQTGEKTATILYTNDFHTAFDPIPAYWLEGSPNLGGAAQLSTLINQTREREKPVFLFDTGDMFTGQMSFLTNGEALMEMMMSMKYDAMAIGNHEFDYGSDNFTKQMDRVPFPVLGANIFYKDSGVRYSRPYTIIEKDGVRLGVIGIIGMDARSVALPSGITNLDFRDPIPIVRELVKELKPEVDLVVVLAHQGKTGPMQTDAENRPEVQRDFDEDIRLTTEVEGIDVFVGGHAHRGIEEPFVNPKTGTIIVQTYGYGTRLGYLKVKVKDRKMVSHEGELLRVWSDKLPPDPIVAAKIARYKKLLAPKIGIGQGVLKERLVRDYNRESSLGNFVADVLREVGNADVGMTNAGGLRADLPKGEVTNGNVYDALPFVNSLVVCKMTGKQIKEVLEQGFSLERGMIQVSGLVANYDLSQTVGERLISLEIGGKPVQDNKIYKVATNSFIWEGGDLYRTFVGTTAISKSGLLSEIVMDYLQAKKTVGLPKPGRLIPANKQDTPDDLYPPENVELKYHSKWSKDHYKKRIKEFKKDPLKFGNIVFLGDSITEGGQDWGRKFGVSNVKNRGISGDLTDGVLQRLNEITYFKPKAVFLLIGINDLSDKRFQNEIASPEYVSNNILEIIKIIHQTTPQTKIYVQTVLPTDREYTKENITKVNQVINSNKKTGGYQVIDLHSAFMDKDGFLKKDLTYDGVHLNAKGYAVWAALVKPFIVSR